MIDLTEWNAEREGVAYLTPGSGRYCVIGLHSFDLFKTASWVARAQGLRWHANIPCCNNPDHIAAALREAERQTR